MPSQSLGVLGGHRVFELSVLAHVCPKSMVIIFVSVESYVLLMVTS